MGHLHRIGITDFSICRNKHIVLSQLLHIIIVYTCVCVCVCVCVLP
jgi:hypothetical protein